MGSKEYPRSRRVADLLRRELALLLQRECSGGELAADEWARWGLITVSAAEVSPDLKNARIYFTALRKTREADMRELQAKLNDLAGRFRHRLARSLPLRVTPKLAFVYDESIERAGRIDALIESLRGDGRPA